MNNCTRSGWAVSRVALPHARVARQWDPRRRELDRPRAGVGISRHAAWLLRSWRGTAVYFSPSRVPFVL